ncbi:MAG: fasciclin domain-containing protein [Deltaproteobacteria bacterium]|nr:fasciclin domain-containing protein [Deltaproteobacteria bacterium]
MVCLFAGSVKADEVKKEEKALTKETNKDIKAADKVIDKDIIATATADAKFSTLVTALKTADLVETLKGPGPYTVFAPTNDAFAKLPPGTLDALLKDAPKLKKVLLYHVANGKTAGKEVMTMKSVKTAQGTSLTITLKDGKALLDGAQLVETDIPTSNGVIHVIDTVMMPKS